MFHEDSEYHRSFHGCSGSVRSLLTVPAFAVEGTLAEYPNCPHLQGHHDAECGYVEAQDEVPCSNKNHDWLSPSSHDCTYKPAVKGVPCAHVHTADCLPKNNVVDPDEDGDASAYIEPNYYADYDEDVTYVQDGYTVICRVLNVRALPLPPKRPASASCAAARP